LAQFQFSIRKASLNESSFCDTNIKGANFEGVEMEGAIFRNSIAPNANFNKANLRKTNFGGVNLRNASFEGANLQNAVFTQAKLQEARFMGANLLKVNFELAQLQSANFVEAQLMGANMKWANLKHANLIRADLEDADLEEANLESVLSQGANYSKANLHRARLANAMLDGVIFKEAKLTEASLYRAILVRTNLIKADLSGAMIYGISVWDTLSDETMQKDLVITEPKEPLITVDNIEVAQFIYLMLNNIKLRGVIDSITSKMVLILGRFSMERKRILDTIREELRNHNYLPVMFDFEKPTNRNLTETITTLAHLSKFIIVDLTDPRSAPHELAALIPRLSIPIMPLIQKYDGFGEENQLYGMFQDFHRYHWVIDPYKYDNLENLIRDFDCEILMPAENKFKELINT